MEGSFSQLGILYQISPRRLILVLGVMVALILAFQTFTMPSRIVMPPFLLPKAREFEQGTLSSNITHPKSIMIRKPSLLSKLLNSSRSPVGLKEANAVEISERGREANPNFRTEVVDEDLEQDDEFDDAIHLGEDGDMDREFSVDLDDGVVLKKVKGSAEGFITLPHALVKAGEQWNNSSIISDEVSEAKGNLPIGKVSKETSKKNKTSITTSVKRNRSVTPPISVSEMSQILFRNHAAYHSMRPRWFSARDRELLAAKAQIEHAPSLRSVPQLYRPAFRNISKFKRSYELMEKMLKVYVYKEGQKPIFHQPLLKGIYASEGWFMKLLEINSQYTVRDPRKAHLFYMPFSSRLLQFALYVRNSHNRRNLEQYLVNYVDMIAAKYPFWNRTGGSDHFLAACHDWAPYETGRAMERSIRALCVADLHLKFRLGKDVSLPQTYVRSAKNPLKDLGGMPATNRSILAFYAGNTHGKLRSILLQHWENKDPEMKIYGPLPRGIARKLAYIQHMKSSKYCICPRGYEVNSPRVVESIFYECVPVIISDNFVPPFFEVLNWEAFSLILLEEDVPRLKEILSSIPEEKFLSLQQGVRRVQHHFLLHKKPVKYDLFHMTLHSVWYNRVYNVRTR